MRGSGSGISDLLAVRLLLLVRHEPSSWGDGLPPETAVAAGWWRMNRAVPVALTVGRPVRHIAALSLELTPAGGPPTAAYITTTGPSLRLWSACSSGHPLLNSARRCQITDRSMSKSRAKRQSTAKSDALGGDFSASRKHSAIRETGSLTSICHLFVIYLSPSKGMIGDSRSVTGREYIRGTAARAGSSHGFRIESDTQLR